MYFAPNWPTLLALPNPIYDPGAQHTYEGQVAGSRGTNKGVVAVVRQPKTTRTPTWTLWRHLQPLQPSALQWELSRLKEALDSVRCV